MKGVGRSPFHVLGVSPSASLETIKKAFTKLALRHHPDTGNTSSYEKFITLRNAYERIRDGTYTLDPGKGVGKVRRETKSNTQQRTAFSEQIFLDYLYQQTGTKITSAQRRELIQLDSSRIPGATYNGPNWDFARRVAIEQELFMTRRNEFHPERDNTEYKNDAKSSSEHEHETGMNHDNLRRRRRR
eukprot:jgi/Psemu1/309154/fgenesh1_kg.478_\